MKFFRQVMQGLTPAEPPRVELYRAGCPKGHILRGERTEGYQALRCPSCGEGVFVLPRSPLPEPPALHRQDRGERSRPVAQGPSAEDSPIPLNDPPPGVDILEVIESEFEESDSELDEETEVVEPLEADETPTPPPRSRSTPKLPRPDRLVQSPSPRRLPAQVVHERPEPEADDEYEYDEEDFDDREGEDDGKPTIGRRRRISKHWLTFAALGLLAVTAISARIRQQWLQGLPKVVEAGRTRGLDALDAGRFDEAKDLLSKAAYAARKLGDQVEGAEEVRQGALEAAIYADLLPETLETILDEAAGGSLDDHAALLNSRYVGRSLLLDGVAEEDPADPKRLVLDYVVLPPSGGTRRGRISLTGLDLIEKTRVTPGQRISCGARLASLERPEGQDWRFRLQPDSGVLLTHPSSLDALGFSGEVPAEPPREGPNP